MSADRVPAFWDPRDRMCFAAPSAAKRVESNGESLGGVVLTGRWICEGHLCNTLSDVPRVHRVADNTGFPYCSQEFNGSRWVLNPEHPAECRCCDRRDKERRVSDEKNRAERSEDQRSEAHAAGVTAERARIRAMLETERKSRTGAAAQALDTVLMWIDRETP